MKHFVVGVFGLLLGCSDSAPSCDEMVKSLETNLKGTGIPVYITAAQCKSAAFSASLRACFSKVKGQRGLEACVAADVNRCLSKASQQGDVDICMSRKESLADVVADATSSLHLDRDKTLFAIERLDNAFDRWAEKHPDTRCPESLESLEGDDLELHDAWHSPLVMKCTEKDFWVLSPGPDRVAGTKDDLDSSQVDQTTHRPRQKP